MTSSSEIPDMPERNPKKKRIPAKQTNRKGKPVESLPKWNVFLHDDEENDVETVQQHIMSILRIPITEVQKIISDAQENTKSLLVTTHLEHAEFVVDRLENLRIHVTMEESRD